MSRVRDAIQNRYALSAQSALRDPLMTEKFGPPDAEPITGDKTDVTWDLPYNQAIIATNTSDGTDPMVMLLDMDHYEARARSELKANVGTL